MKFNKPAWATAIGVAALAPLQALAESPFLTAQKAADEVRAKSGVGATKPLPEIIGNIINALLGFLGIVFLVLLLYAGFIWMTAGGDKAKVEKAQSMIQQAVIGLVVITAAFAISSFVLGSLVNVTGQ